MLFEHVWLAAHATGAPQLPVVSHVSTPLPEHFVDPIAHVPTHIPPEHVCMPQSTGMPHAPVASHV
jgi:hypothetical protein